MALWGVRDTFSDLVGTVTVDYNSKVIDGDSTTFVTAGISTGDVISIGVGKTFGEAIVTGVTSETQISIASTQFLTLGIPEFGGTGVAYTASQKPSYTLHDTNYGADDIFGVDNAETGIAATVTVQGKAGAFAVQHAGWVAVASTYIDSNGRMRVKSETLVAMGRDANGFGGITGDAEDDATFPDTYTP